MVLAFFMQFIPVSRVLEQMIYRLVLLLSLFLPTALNAQVDTALQDSVMSLFEALRFSPDGDKMIASNKLENLFTEYYSESANFETEFDSVPFLGQLTSKDRKVRLLCWNLALDNGEFQYHCIIRHRQSKGEVVLTILQDNDDDWRKLVRKPLRPGKWYGALYYRILTNKYKGRTTYTLIGWDGNNSVTNRKIVDVLSIQGNSISLGSGIFMEDRRTVYRLIYEYANDAVMALNFDEKQNLIVMDHLAPEDTRFKDQYQFYGPDFSYDALKFEKGKWKLKTDIYAKNKGLNNLSKDDRPGDFED